jgi:hypothetical protein
MTITITTSISTFLSEVMAIVFANGMCASRRRLLKSQARMSRCQIHDQLSPVDPKNAVLVDAPKAGINA